MFSREKSLDLLAVTVLPLFAHFFPYPHMSVLLDLMTQIHATQKYITFFNIDLVVGRRLVHMSLKNKHSPKIFARDCRYQFYYHINDNQVCTTGTARLLNISKRSSDKAIHILHCDKVSIRL